MPCPQPPEWLSTHIDNLTGVQPATLARYRTYVARGARQWAHKTLYYGDRSFTANDRESPGSRRGYETVKLVVLQSKTSNKRSARTHSLVIFDRGSSPSRPTSECCMTSAAHCSAGTGHGEGVAMSAAVAGLG